MFRLMRVKRVKGPGDKLRLSPMWGPNSVADTSPHFTHFRSPRSLTKGQWFLPKTPPIY